MKETSQFKRFLSALLLAALVMSCVPAFAQAAEKQYGYLVIQNQTVNRVVNFRRQANTNDDTNFPIARLPEYWVVEVLGSQTVGKTVWYKVSANINTAGSGPVNYQTGYIMASFVQLMTAQQQAAFLQNPGNTYNPNGTAPGGTVPAATAAPNAGVYVHSGEGLGFLVTTKAVTMYNQPDGTALTWGGTIPQGTLLRYYLFVDRPGTDSDWAQVYYGATGSTVQGMIRGDGFVLCDTNRSPVVTPAPDTSALRGVANVKGFVKAIGDSIRIWPENAGAGNYYAPYNTVLPYVDGPFVENDQGTQREYVVISYQGLRAVIYDYVYTDAFGNPLSVKPAAVTATLPVVQGATPAPTAISGLPAGIVIGYVRTTKGGVNLRETPGGKVLNANKLIALNQVLPCYAVYPKGTYGNYEWAMVQYNSQVGYIRGDCYEMTTSEGVPVSAVTPAPVVTLAPTAAPTVNPGTNIVPGETYGLVTADNVFFRKTMSTSGDFWARLPAGWMLTVLDRKVSGKITWYKVRGGIPENPSRTYTGYIHGDYFYVVNAAAPATASPNPLQPTGLPTPAPTALPGGNSNYAVVVVDGVNVRQTPGGATVSVLRTNTVVNVLSKPAGNTANDWYFIEYFGFSGYLPATALRVLNTAELNSYVLPPAASATAGPIVNPTLPVVVGPTGAPASVLGYVKLTKDKVNIRKTPGGTSLTATDKSKLPIGQVLAYTEGPTGLISGYNWVLVTYNGITGYVRSDCYQFCDEKGNFIAAPTAAPTALPTAAPSVPGAPTQAPAASDQGYIKLVKGNVNLRSSPWGTTLGQLAKDTVLPYFNISKKDNTSLETWYEVYSVQLGSFGYILSSMAMLCDAKGNPVTPGALPTTTPVNIVGYVATKVSSVWLRVTPSADADTAGQVKAKGTVLPQIGPVVKNGYDWYPVQTADGVRAYLRGDCVFSLAEWQLEEYQKTGKVSTPTPGPATPRPGNSSYIQTIADKLYVRQTPSTKAYALGQLSIGTVVKFLTTQTIGRGTANEVTWYQISFNGQVGWVHGQFVRILSNAEYDAMSATATPLPGVVITPTPAPTLTNLSDVAVTTADRVRIRAGGSMASKEIGMVYNTGTQMTYLGKYTAPTQTNPYYWYNVRYGSVTGWICGDFVHVLTVAEKAALNPTVQPTGSTVVTYRTLYKNSSGDDVYALQLKLYQLGYLAADQVNGYYLASTEAAVAAFQRAKGLTVDGIAGAATQHALYGTSESTTPTTPGGTDSSTPGSSTTVTLYPVEKSDWYTGDIQKVWTVGSAAILTDVYTGISFRAQRLYGDNHADCEPVTAADTAAICAIYGVTRTQEIEDREQELQSYRRRPTWVTIGGRTFCASVYGIPHNYSGDRIANNNYTGQFCVHFTNSRTHTTNIVDPDASYNNYFGHQSAIQYAYTHSISGTK